MQVHLSTGAIISSDIVEKAEFYSEDALNVYGCNFHRATGAKTPFLVISLKDGCERVFGPDAARDAELLETVNIRVERCGIPVEK